MLARLQQALTLGAITLALAWAWWAATAGHPLWAVVGVLAVLCGHAVVLAAEFVLLRRARGDDPSPRATPGQLLAAWWGEVWAAPAVFCWRQPFRSRAVADHLPAQAHGRTGVLFIHGFVCNPGW